MAFITWQITHQFGGVRKYVFRHNGKLQIFSPVSGDSSSAKFIYPISSASIFPEDFFAGDPDAKMCSYQKINDRTLSMTAKKGAEVVLQGVIIVAVDGKSQDVILASPDAVTSVYNEKAKAKRRRKGKRRDSETKPFTTRNNLLGPRLRIEGNFFFLTAMEIISRLCCRVRLRI